jgi:hypothetical protein
MLRGLDFFGSRHRAPLSGGGARIGCLFSLGLAVSAPFAVPASGAGLVTPAASFHRDVEPILEDYCYECHGDGAKKGKVAFDELSDADLTARTDLWFAVLKNLRSNIMPVAGHERPPPHETETLVRWIKYQAFGIRPDDPDPGRVTLHRLNRVEYGRTVKALLGVDYPSEIELPPDDTGDGFDNIGDVLSVSPLLLEKYLQAAQTIVTSVVPQSRRVVPVTVLTGRDFRDWGPEGDLGVVEDGDDGTPAFRAAIGHPLAFRDALTVTHAVDAPCSARFRISFHFEVRGPFNFDPGRCLMTVKIDGQPVSTERIGWQYRKQLYHEVPETWKAGRHAISVTLEPLPPAPLPADVPPAEFDDPQHLEVRIVSVRVEGPYGSQWSVEPTGYRSFFPEGPPPDAPSARDRYARRILGDFASRAFRRPVDEATLARLSSLAAGVEAQPGGSFEQGISRAMMAILASPRFLFRIEEPDPQDTRARYPLIDEYSLASRLSYLLWSTTPDDELFDLARQGLLRANLHRQVFRMLRDPRSAGFVRNFTGQWLQARDVEFVPINKRAVLGLGPPKGLPRIEFDVETRKAMREETESVFNYVMQGDRSVLELVDSDYTFLNEKLAKEYGVPGVVGKQMRLVTLPEGSLRGGILTEGTVLTVTSNPTRTSPVKRGQFILQNVLGTPAPPPPPNIPPLELSKAAFGGHDPTLREMLTEHRKNPLCSSCHGRMDPLGLALESFNALGEWRTADAGQPIITSGKLISGEAFRDVRELKHIITHERRSDFYRCLTEKTLTYALGRSLGYGDTEAVDRIVDDLERSGGRFSALLVGVIDSVPFERERRPGDVAPAQSAPSFAALLSPQNDHEPTP